MPTMPASKKRDILNAVWSAGSDRRGTTQRRWFARGKGNVSALEGASSELRRKKSGDSRYWIGNVEQAISSRPPFAPEPLGNLVERGMLE